MSLRHALLGLLAEEPSSGYDLLKRFETSLAFVWPAKQSQIYGELTRLADAGLIVVSDTGARNRKEYDITDDGREELRHWMSGTEVGGSYRSEALLRVFFLWTLPVAERVAFMEGFAAYVGGRRADLQEIRDTAEWSGGEAQLCAWLTLEYGLRHTVTTQEWAHWAVEQLRSAAAEAESGAGAL